MEFKILPPEKAQLLRKSFIRQFVDTAGDHYQKHIATLIPYSDGFYYDGYLWECLLDNDNYQKMCSMETAAAFLNDKTTVFAMWDLFSNERVRDHKRFSTGYPKDTVISMQGTSLAHKITEEWNNEQYAWNNGYQLYDLWLPADIYCFDESMSWYAIFTHEGWDQFTNPELDEDAYIRICFLHSQTFCMPYMPRP